MYQRFIKPLGLFTLLLFAGFFTSCQKEDDVTEVENFVLQSMMGLENDCAAGRAGCYELVFPITLQFSDSSLVSVNNYDELKQAIREWIIANGGRPKPWNRPTLVFPIQVINEAGEIITVETQEELRELKALCTPGPGGHGGGHHHGPCFTLVFPITLSFPDSTQVTVNSKEEMREAIHAWKEANPGTPGRPDFVFPFTVELKDGTQVIVNTKEELRALKEDCRG